MSERPEEVIDFLRSLLMANDLDCRVHTQEILDYIIQLEAENEKLKADLIAYEWPISIIEGLRAQLKEAKADSKRLAYFIAVRLRRSSLKMNGTCLYTMRGFRGGGDFRAALDEEIEKEVEWSEADRLLDESLEEPNHE